MNKESIDSWILQNLEEDPVELFRLARRRFPEAADADLALAFGRVGRWLEGLGKLADSYGPNVTVGEALRLSSEMLS